MTITHTSAYKFIQLNHLETWRDTLKALAVECGIKGTILLGVEGINISLSGPQTNLDDFKNRLRQYEEFSDLIFKDSYGTTTPFKKMMVKIRNEIVTIGNNQLDVSQNAEYYITPNQLKDWYDQGIKFDMIDTRNDYEYLIGTFKDAVKLPLKNFRDFEKILPELDTLKHNGKPKVIVCTGGIRCEKALPVMLAHGFEQVYHLQGGIISYFKECGGEHYEGECFVFDDRVAIDTQLNETDTIICEACHTPIQVHQQNQPHYCA